MLLAASHNEIICLFGMSTPDVLALGAALFVIGQVGTPITQIGNELVQALSVFGLGAIGFQERDRVVDLSAPQPEEECPQQLGFGHAASADQTGQVVAFLAAMIPVQNQFRARPRGEPLGEELGDPACAVAQ
jgi:hypothetical protein